jgi:hypothetical protein
VKQKRLVPGSGLMASMRARPPTGRLGLSPVQPVTLTRHPPRSWRSERARDACTQTSCPPSNALRENRLDFGTPVIELIESGEFKGTVGQNPYLMGYMSMLLAYSAGHPTEVSSGRARFGPVPATVDTGVTVLHKGDIGRYRTVPKV